MKGKIIFSIALVFFLIAGSADSASAFGLVVNQSSPSCVGGRSYYSSIQEAVYGANTGDTIIVCPGVYGEAVDIFKSLNVYSYSDANTTTITSPQNSTAQYAVSITAENANISGFKIVNAGPKGKLTSNTGIYGKAKNIGISNIAIETSGALNYGILLNSSSNSVIENATIKTEGSGSIGVYLDESSRVSMLNSSVSTQGSYAHAIYIYSSPDSTISYSKISTSGGNAYGTALYSSKDVSIANNIIATSGQNAIGIYTEGGENSSILENSIATLGEWAMGIYFRPNSNSKVSENSITTSGAYGWGIYLLGGSSNSTISGNSIKTSGIYGHGIYLLFRSSSNRISGNRIETNLNSDANAWALKVDISENNIFINNHIIGEAQTVNNSFTYDGNIMLRGVADKPNNTNFYADMDKYLAFSTSGPAWIYLNISYSDEEANFVDESTLGIFRLSNKTPEKLESRANKEEKYVHGNFSEAGIFALLGSVPAKKNAEIAVFANSIERSRAENFFSFLKGRGMMVSVFNASEFEKEKTKKIIIILGGPDAPEGIGGVIRSLINESEQNYLRAKGNKKMLAIDDKFSEGQRVFVIAGSDRFETAKAHAENKYGFLANLKNLV